MRNKKIFLTSARRDWLAKFFQNATVVLLAGTVGGDLFLKISTLWRAVLVMGFVTGFGLGLLFATGKDARGED